MIKAKHINILKKKYFKITGVSWGPKKEKMLDIKSTTAKMKKTQKNCKIKLRTYLRAKTQRNETQERKDK